MARYRYRRVKVRVRGPKKIQKVQGYKGSGYDKTFFFDDDVSSTPMSPSRPQPPVKKSLPLKYQARRLKGYVTEEYKKSDSIFSKPKKAKYKSPLGLQFR